MCSKWVSDKHYINRNKINKIKLYVITAHMYLHIEAVCFIFLHITHWFIKNPVLNPHHLNILNLDVTSGLRCGCEATCLDSHTYWCDSSHTSKCDWNLISQ